MYARIYWSASQGPFGDRLFSESLLDWTSMKRDIDDVLAKYPDTWNVNNFARFACLAGDKEKAAELIGRIKGPPLIAASGNPRFFSNARIGLPLRHRRPAGRSSRPPIWSEIS